MSAGIVVEAGGPADLPAVMAVMEDSFDPSFGEAWTGSQCAGLLPMTGVWLTIARDGEAPIGFALSRIAAGEAELLLLAVRSGAQRRGAGKMLLDRFISDSRSRGAEKLHLEVRDGNHAVTLYKQAGFCEIGRRINYYRGASGQQFDALTLGRSANS